MTFALACRSVVLSLAALLFSGLMLVACWAQAAPADLPPEKAKQFLEFLSDPEIKAWLEGKAAAVVDEPSPDIADALAGWEAGIHNRLGALFGAIPRVPEEIARAAGVLSRDVNAGRPGLVLAILAILIAVGLGAEWLVRRALGRVRGAAGQEPRDQTVLADVAGLVTFALASAGLFLAFDWPPLLRRIMLTLLLAVVAFRVVRLVARLFLERDEQSSPLEQSPAIEPSSPIEVSSPLETNPARPERKSSTEFWLLRASLVAGFLFFGWAIASLMPALGFSIEVVGLAAFSFGLGILATAIEVVWRRPEARGTPVRRSLLTLFLLALWLVWIGGLLGLLWVGIFVLIVPAVVRGVGAAAQSFADRFARGGAVGVVTKVLIARGARALVIGAAVAWLAYIWRIRAAAFAGSEAGSYVIYGLLNGIIIVLVADLLWQLSKALIEYRINLPAKDGSSPEELARSGRLRTLLPIFRNALAVFIGVVTILTILAGLGVQILPLIAGAGIFGVAIGFGSQTLVKDVLSGMFFMMDDAFRVGEYIQSGSYKGTVESFSLRSVRLRHHRGAIFTVPFGSLGAIQNTSRDWVIDKMTLNVTYDSNVDLARKLIKKIGLELAADPEFAADTLQPLKMQGVDSFGDFAIVLRLKLMTKPGAQFPIKRRAYMMIKQAFDENGIKIAVPTVHVEGGSEKAAAAYQATKAPPAAEPAAEPA